MTIRHIYVHDHKRKVKAKVKAKDSEGEWGIRWMSISARGLRQPKEKTFPTEAARDAFVKKLIESDEYAGIISWLNKTADSLTVTYAQLKEKFKQGKWEAQADLRKGGVTWGTQEIRVVGTGKVMQVRVEEIPATTDAGVLKHTETEGDATVKVYWDAGNKEYTCRLFVGGKENVNASYFTDEFEDAKNTAKDMARRANTQK